MLKRLLLAQCALTLLLAASCGPSYHLIKVRSVAEAEFLRDEAAAKNLRGDEITTAEVNLALANEANSPKESADYADLAAALYRVALARHSVEESASALEQSEAALNDSRAQVTKYHDILTRVNSRDAAPEVAPAPSAVEEPAGVRGGKGPSAPGDSKKGRK